jgi:phenylalanyl-tRNA synthetase alpha chain
MTNTVDNLHPHEKKILAALRELGKSTTGDISKKTGIPEPSVHKAGHWSSIKGLIKYDEKRTEDHKLTPEGNKYLKEGLPEKNLIRLVSQGITRIATLKKKHPQLSVGLAWAKKKAWINIAENRLTLTPKGEKALTTQTPTERGLAGSINEENRNELEVRKLIEVTGTREKRLYLTQKGKAHASGIGKIKEEINQLTTEMLRTGSWKGKAFRPYAMDTPVPVVVPGKEHPYTQFINKTRQKLITLGFEETRGPYVESEFWNSDALFMPHDHPARGIHDIFNIKTTKKARVRNRLALGRVAKTHKRGWITGSSGWGLWDPDKTLNTILRSHTTSVSARTVASKPKIPGKYFTISRNFRPDEIDATHFVEFHQLDGIVLGETLTLKHLVGFLDLIAREVVGAEKRRFRPGYFPFTEPSVELDCYINGKWVEIGGSGIFRPEVTVPLGVDVPVLAWGLGMERLSMLKLGAKDIRELYSDDLEWLRKKEMVK